MTECDWPQTQNPLLTMLKHGVRLCVCVCVRVRVLGYCGGGRLVSAGYGLMVAHGRPDDVFQRVLGTCGDAPGSAATVPPV